MTMMLLLLSFSPLITTSTGIALEHKRSRIYQSSARHSRIKNAIPLRRFSREKSQRDRQVGSGKWQNCRLLRYENARVEVTAFRTTAERSRWNNAQEHEPYTRARTHTQRRYTYDERKREGENTGRRRGLVTEWKREYAAYARSRNARKINSE